MNISVYYHLTGPLPWLKLHSLYHSRRITTWRVTTWRLYSIYRGCQMWKGKGPAKFYLFMLHLTAKHFHGDQQMLSVIYPEFHINVNQFLIYWYIRDFDFVQIELSISTIFIPPEPFLMNLKIFIDLHPRTGYDIPRFLVILTICKVGFCPEK